MKKMAHVAPFAVLFCLACNAPEMRDQKSGKVIPTNADRSNQDLAEQARQMTAAAHAKIYFHIDLLKSIAAKGENLSDYLGFFKSEENFSELVPLLQKLEKRELQKFIEVLSPTKNVLNLADKILPEKPICAADIVAAKLGITIDDLIKILTETGYTLAELIDLLEYLYPPDPNKPVVVGVPPPRVFGNGTCGYFVENANLSCNELTKLKMCMGNNSVCEPGYRKVEVHCNEPEKLAPIDKTLCEAISNPKPTTTCTNSHGNPVEFAIGYFICDPIPPTPTPTSTPTAVPTESPEPTVPPIPMPTPMPTPIITPVVTPYPSPFPMPSPVS